MSNLVRWRYGDDDDEEMNGLFEGTGSLASDRIEEWNDGANLAPQQSHTGNYRRIGVEFKLILCSVVFGPGHRFMWSDTEQIQIHIYIRNVYRCVRLATDRSGEATALSAIGFFLFFDLALFTMRVVGGGKPDHTAHPTNCWWQKMSIKIMAQRFFNLVVFWD